MSHFITSLYRRRHYSTHSTPQENRDKNHRRDTNVNKNKGIEGNKLM
jgi:hypothetical protein